MFDITCVEIQRLAYNIRDILLKEEVDVETVCKSSVEITLEIINIMDRVNFNLHIFSFNFILFQKKQK